MVCTTIEEAKRIWQHLRVACDPESKRKGVEGLALAVCVPCCLPSSNECPRITLTVAMWEGRAAQTNELLQALAVLLTVLTTSTQGQLGNAAEAS